MNRLVHLIVFALAAVATHQELAGQERNEARELVRFLTYQTTERPGREAFLAGMLGGCGDAGTDRAMAIKLASLGESAVTELEEAFNSLDAEGADSPYAPNAYWLLTAYAKIRGVAAGPWLERFRGSKSTQFLLRQIDAATAVSLKVTSFVTGTRASGRVIPCRDLEPRDTLDSLILGVFHADEASIKVAFDLRSVGASFQKPMDAASDVAPSAPTGLNRSTTGIGFRFYSEAPWGDPPETFQEPRQGRRFDASRRILTEFVRIDGHTCGHYDITFLGQARSGDPIKIDSNDFPMLVNTIRSCVAAR